MDKGDSQQSKDVQIDELSDSMLRVTVGGLTADVSVERIYRTDLHFGEFRSLDTLIKVLRKIAEEQS